MPNLLFLSDNQSFAEDLSGQIKLYAPDFNIFYEDNGQNFYDLILLDEKVETAKNTPDIRHRFFCFCRVAMKPPFPMLN